MKKTVPESVVSDLCYILYRVCASPAAKTRLPATKGICIPDYSKESFRCKCDDGYEGIPCGKCQKPRYLGRVLLFMYGILNLWLKGYCSYFLVNANFVFRTKAFNITIRRENYSGLVPVNQSEENLI